MSKMSKVSNTLLNNRAKAMSKVLKVVFAAFTQHCILSNVTHVGSVKSELYIWGLSPLQEGRLFEKHSILWV